MYIIRMCIYNKDKKKKKKKSMRLLISGSWVRAPRCASLFLLTTTDLLLQPYFQFLVGVGKKQNIGHLGIVVSVLI